MPEYTATQVAAMTGLTRRQVGKQGTQYDLGRKAWPGKRMYSDADVEFILSRKGRVGRPRKEASRGD